MNKLSFIIPDSKQLRSTNLRFLDLLANYPEFFYDDFEITSTFGCSGGSSWTGGGIMDRVIESEGDLIKVQALYKVYNVNYSLVFTNSLLAEQDLYSRYDNFLLDTFNKEGNSIIYNRDFLKTYIQKNYPNYTYTKSITSGLTFEEVQNYSKNELTVLPIIYNDKDDFLRRLKYPENIEILVNENCIPDCPMKNLHYKAFEEAILYNKTTFNACIFKDRRTRDRSKLKQCVQREDFHRFTDLGITHFKISGRGSNPRTAAQYYMDFFTKPKYFTLVEGYLNNNNYWADVLDDRYEPPLLARKAKEKNEFFL